ncbi:MAG: energy-coupling factor transporter ATPase [delta proteobacterium ML8_F1]|nr:MAG: energy-coupling factor transporter ATPase [delta proteobacterium ML8_F1]
MAIVVENLTYVYDQGTPFQTTALEDISLTIEKGEFIGLIGHTGSGKSTLIQHFNGLIKPSSGKIIINGLDISGEKVKLSELRKKVGLVFQYPEYQLFEETVYKDIAFGPSNLGLDDSEIQRRVIYAMDLVNLDYDEFKEKSPFELSGGQKRRVAIAGVLAMEPEVIILDEPTAGLDPRGRDEILQQIKRLHDEHRVTVILVSHSMEDISRLANRIIVMHQGRIEMSGSKEEVFSHGDRLEAIGLGLPEILYLVKALRERGVPIDQGVINFEGVEKTLINLLGGSR